MDSIGIGELKLPKMSMQVHIPELTVGDVKTPNSELVGLLIGGVKTPNSNLIGLPTEKFLKLLDKP